MLAALEFVENISFIAWYAHLLCGTMLWTVRQNSQALLHGSSVDETPYFSLLLVMFWLQVTVTFIPAPSFILCCQLGSCALSVKVATLAGMVDAEPLE